MCVPTATRQSPRPARLLRTRLFQPLTARSHQSSDLISASFSSYFILVAKSSALTRPDVSTETRAPLSGGAACTSPACTAFGVRSFARSLLCCGKSGDKFPAGKIRSSACIYDPQLGFPMYSSYGGGHAEMEDNIFKVHSPCVFSKYVMFPFAIGGTD